MYIKVRTKLFITLFLTTCWVGLSLYIQIPWYHAMAIRLGIPLALMAMCGLAVFPGAMVAMTIVGMLLDKPRRNPVVEKDLEDITILVAAYNEQEGIYETLQSLAQQEYPAKLIINVIDNNSKDNTKKEIERAIKDFPQANINYMFEPIQGKFAALNHGLAKTTTRFVLTIDADTYIYKDAVKYIANTMIQENKNKEVAAIAGTVLVRNSRDNLLAAIQEWEYFLSITAAKRMQGLFQTILVAQGAFSIYDTKKVKAIGGWKDTIGEDIVVTWELLARGNKTYYEDRAICFTNVPTDFKIFFRQRARWARGMVEAFKHFSLKSGKNPYSKLLIATDLTLFLIDFSVTFFYIPGIIACIFFGDYLIVGPMSLLLIPLALIDFTLMFFAEKRTVFEPLNLKIRKHYFAFIIFALTYFLITSPICVYGYAQEFINARRKWK